MSDTPSHRIPAEPEVLPYDPIAQVRTDGELLLEVVADHGFGRRVASCPGWDLGDLVWHVGDVWSRWGRIVSEGVTTLEGLQALDRPVRPSDDMLLDWVTAAHTSVFSALVDASADTEVWTWTGTNRTAAWVRRRMAQETAVHRWDASDAVGIPYEIPATLAADGIDEFLMWFAGRRMSDGAAPVNGTVHLHCTDDDLGGASNGEWLVCRLDESGAEFTREHAKGDAAVRGRANDLLLWLWRRDGGPVDIVGDAAVAERFRAFPML